MEITHGANGSSIGDERRTSKGLAKGCVKGKGTRTETVGKTGHCKNSGVPRGVHLDGTDMDDYVGNCERRRGLHRDSLSGSHMDGLFVDNEKQVIGRHHLAKFITWIQTGGGYGGKDVPADCGVGL